MISVSGCHSPQQGFLRVLVVVRNGFSKHAEEKLGGGTSLPFTWQALDGHEAARSGSCETSRTSPQYLLAPRVFRPQHGGSMEYSLHLLSTDLQQLACGCFPDAPPNSRIMAVCTVQGPPACQVHCSQLLAKKMNG